MSGFWPHGFPRPVWPCLVGREDGWPSAATAQAIQQHSKEFLVTEGAAGFGPWLCTTACRASWVAQMPSQGPGPGSSASRLSWKEARRTSAGAPSSAHSGSSQQPTASSRSGKEDQGSGLVPQTSRCPERSSTCYCRPVALQHAQCLGTPEPRREAAQEKAGLVPLLPSSLPLDTA